MKNIKVGNIVEVMKKVGNGIIYYQLEVNEVKAIDKDVIAYGNGIDANHEKLANQFTHKIDSSNFNKVIQ
ncbi:hypothetical protein ABD87_22740 [Lysinibacillus sphaericus]|uniref:hypothetical protein n=1 Tax=Lysinibacillus sphaericus TaxID=1421 RepID=UPI0018CF12FA|nr:hypothetical protein [Lysinibacillus sphaericus]MBG9732245.1 hypothetical protein [Lysinibacillus sphaericus]